MDFTTLVNIATSVSPMVATILLSIGSSVMLLKKDFSNMKKRIEQIEQMDLSSRLARIEADISWIRSKLEGRI
jgi:L-fucose isomerase-like protein